MDRTRKRIGLAALASSFALAGVLVGLHGDDKTKLAALTPTSTLPAQGCRFSDGSRGPCDRLSTFCEATNTKAPNCDIDGQPRIDRNPSQGCATNTLPDVGADEFYAPGCEPLVGGAVTTTASTTTVVTVSTLDAAYQDFKVSIVAATLYKTWTKANPGESAKLDSYIGAVDHGMTEPQSAPPSMATATGRALVAAVHERQVGK